MKGKETVEWRKMISIRVEKRTLYCYTMRGADKEQSKAIWHDEKRCRNEENKKYKCTLVYGTWVCVNRLAKSDYDSAERGKGEETCIEN